MTYDDLRNHSPDEDHPEPPRCDYCGGKLDKDAQQLADSSIRCFKCQKEASLRRRHPMRRQ